MADAHLPLLAGLRVLIVEDEYLIASEMELWLRQAGAEVIGPAPDVEQALALVGDAAGALDAAVLDINLGANQTAHPVAQRLDDLKVPYLFSTGDVKLADPVGHAGRLRLEKPISERELLRELARLLGSRSRSS